MLRLEMKPGGCNLQHNFYNFICGRRGGVMGFNLCAQLWNERSGFELALTGDTVLCQS